MPLRGLEIGLECVEFILKRHENFLSAVAAKVVRDLGFDLGEERRIFHDNAANLLEAT